MRAADHRARRRRALYVIGILPSLLMLLVSGRLVLLLQYDDEGHQAYAASDYSGAQGKFAANRILNPVERWIAPFNEGDARYRLEDYAEAIAAFEEALRFVPSEWECPVRINLALAHEAAGDAIVAQGDRSEAEAQWKQGRAALGPCAAPQDGAADQSAEPSKDSPTVSPTDSPTNDRAADSSESDTKTGSEENPVEGSEAAVTITAARVDERLSRKLGDEPPRSPKSASVDPSDETTKAKEQIVEDRNKEARKKRSRNENRDGRSLSSEPQW